MKFSASWNGLKLTEPEARITSGSAGTVTAEFTFDNSWEGYDKTAVFRCGDTSREVLLPESGVCAVPWETLLPGRRLRVGVYGSKAGKRLPTVYADAGYIERGAEPSETAKEPTGTVYEQLLERIKALEAPAQGGAETLAIHVTLDETGETYTADKTFDEIRSAVQAGKIVYVVLNGTDIVPLSTVFDDAYAFDSPFISVYILESGNILVNYYSTLPSVNLDGTDVGKVPVVQKDGNYALETISGGGGVEFSLLWEYTVTEADLLVSRVGISQDAVPGLSTCRVLVVQLVFETETPLTKWLGLFVSNVKVASLSGVSTSKSKIYTATANRLFGKWVGTFVYEAKGKEAYNLPVFTAETGSSDGYNLTGDIRSVAIGSYASDWGLTAGAVIRVWGMQ